GDLVNLRGPFAFASTWRSRKPAFRRPVVSSQKRHLRAPSLPLYSDCLSRRGSPLSCAKKFWPSVRTRWTSKINDIRSPSPRGGASDIRRTADMEYLIGTAMSVRFDVEGPDHLGPLLRFVGDELAEIGGQARKHRTAFFSETPP